jgi:hypothetical protein
MHCYPWSSGGLEGLKRFEVAGHDLVGALVDYRNREIL